MEDDDCTCPKPTWADYPDGPEPCPACKDREPTDDEIYNRPGVEGGIGYPLDS